MAKINANYEVVYILDPSLSEEATAALVAKFKGIVETNGTVTEVDEWGKRRLAYPINDLMEGYYVLMTFTAAAAIPAELDRVFRITDGVMRSMIVCKDEV
ncbi:MAG: 30S ribosomal protein S6 [Oscillospiraceae bacterium]|nr:30S ribosomal protein S6 [Oscillospiraceae bacterium]